MPEKLNRLRTILGRVRDLETTASVLEWDQETYMPAGAIEARAHQIGTVLQLAHDLFTTDEVGELLDAVEGDGLADGTVEAAIVKVTRRDYDRATRLPPTLVARLARASSIAKEAWKEARDGDRFDVFAPHLRSIVDLNIEKAEALGHTDSIYDPLLDEWEPGMKTHEVADLFGELRRRLVPIVRAIAEAPQSDDALLRRRYPHEVQWDFGLEVIRDFGYDFNRGRQDVSAHPFTTHFSVNDVRLTTRIDEDFFSPGFFGTLHEAGHGLYEQGVDPRLERTPLAGGTSLGMHESQSRLWENLIGRSLPFWTHYFPILQSRVNGTVGSATVDDFYRAVNCVRPSLIRVEADEVTYNLHIMLRFEIEIDLVEGRLDVDAVPELWNDRMEEFLGIRPEDNATGALQDIHWSLGALGYFPTYTLGNLISVQLFDRLTADIPDVMDQVASGRFDTLLAWLREHVHRHGRTMTASEILEKTCGQDLSVDPWLRYVTEKFGRLYGPLA